METSSIRLKTMSIFVLILFLLFCSGSALQPRSSSRSVHVFKRSVVASHDKLSLQEVDTLKDFDPLVRIKRDSSADVTETESEKKDKVCEGQKASFSSQRDKLSKGERLEETYVFENETKYNLALAWAGENDDGTLLVLTTSDGDQFLEPKASTLWRSTDHGRSWQDWSDKVNNKVFRKDDGLQRNPHNPKKVYLISYEHFIYVTQDGGLTWSRSDLKSDEQASSTVDEQLEFHPQPEYEDYVAIISDDRQLYVTHDNFRTQASPIKSSVHSVKWGTTESKTEKCLFVTTGDIFNPLIHIGPEMMDLEKYDSDMKTWKTILRRVVLFNVQGKFIYASIFKSERPQNQEDERLMMISSDGGTTWGEAQLPTLTGDRFYSVLDMSEGLIFMHVDHPGDTGHGDMYTSSSSGLVYAISLRNHLFPNYNKFHDFIKVESMRGVYLASQMYEDKSIHTVITYNRGGEWKNLSRPSGVECQNDEEEGCYLQVHNAYSIHRGINANPPYSQKAAYGLLFVHAHVASNLQTTDPDVFLSTDGGYNFKRVLRGPHAYEIADSGGLLVAVPLTTEHPDTIKFSTDEGNCWHTYKFTSDKIRFTGLLAEPGGKSMTIGVWGYQEITKKWTVNVINFNTVVTNECQESDYIQWMPHTSLNNRPGFEGCLLGMKETFKKIKQDSWCRNGYFKNMIVEQTNCKCTEEDYECDYGFYRPENSTKCVRQADFKADVIDICQDGRLEQLKTAGYRLIPGDICDTVNGFHPVSDITDLKARCNNKNLVIKQDMQPPPENTGSSALLLTAIAIIILVPLVVVAAFLTYKMVLLRRHNVPYKYSQLKQADAEVENALIAQQSLFSDTSDNEEEQDTTAPTIKPSFRPKDVKPLAHSHNGVKPQSNPFLDRKPPVESYHDDSDDDMLG